MEHDSQPVPGHHDDEAERLTGSQAVAATADINLEGEEQLVSASKTAVLADNVPVFDWTALRPGDRIVIYELSGHRQVGTVDLVSDAGDVLWIRYSELNSRRLVHAAEVAGITCQAAEVGLPRLAALAKAAP